MIYLYCLVSADRDPPPATLRGLAGAPVRQVSEHSAAAWVSDLPGGIDAVTPDLARAHDAVIREAMHDETPLPGRFGQLFADEATLRRSLVEHCEAIAIGLARVRGSVEMTIRLLMDADEPAPPAPSPRSGAHSGREYLALLRDRQRAAERAQQRASLLQARVAQAVGGLPLAEVRSAPSPSGRSVTISHLVACGDIARYRHVVRELAGREPRLRLMLSGPWAPYSFSELSGV
jgi:hypothetical protein